MPNCEFWGSWQGKTTIEGDNESCLVKLGVNQRCRGIYLNCRVLPEEMGKYLRLIIPKTGNSQEKRRITPTHLP